MIPVPIHPGVYRITLPMPGKMPGPVNTYLFRGRYNTTLLDSGTILTGRFLKKALAQLGLRIKDVDRVVLTHGHVDHFGGLKAIRGKFLKTASIYAHKEDIEAIETGAEASPAAYRHFLTVAGAPIGLRIGVGMAFSMFRFFNGGCRVDYGLQDGDTISMGDYEAHIVATPGHTRGSLCVYLEKDGVLFSGDHILGHITPNALVMLEENQTLPIRLSQKEYFDSLEKISRLAPKIIYPAHGDAVEKFSDIQRLYKNNYFQRQKVILATVKADPEKSIYQMARKLFPQVNANWSHMDLFLAISEIYTHIQVLEADGYVRTQTNNKRIYVEAI